MDFVLVALVGTGMEPFRPSGTTKGSRPTGLVHGRAVARPSIVHRIEVDGGIAMMDKVQKFLAEHTDASADEILKLIDRRAWDALREAGVSIGDLLSMREKEILRISGFGKKGILYAFQALVTAGDIDPEDTRIWFLGVESLRD